MQHASPRVMRKEDEERVNAGPLLFECENWNNKGPRMSWGPLSNGFLDLDVSATRNEALGACGGGRQLNG